jgi:hypothetical protein
MIRISSRATWFLKWVFPWLGFLLVVLIALLIGFVADPNGIGSFVIIPIVLGIGGYARTKSLRRLIDVVYDADDHLVLVNDGEEDRVLLSDIVDIFPWAGKWWHVTVHLRYSRRFGDVITFMPQSSPGSFWFPRLPVIDELISRHDRMRFGSERE